MPAPVLRATFPPGSTPVDCTISDIMDAHYGSSPGNVPQRQDQGWTGSITVSQLAIIFNVSGTLSAANDVAPWIVLPFAFTLFSRSRMGIKTLPTVTNSVMRCYHQKI